MATQSNWRLIDSPTERTTAATDILLAMQAIGGAIYLYQSGGASPWKTMIWATAFSLLALSAFLGAIVHGFSWEITRRNRLKRGLSLALGLTIALFFVGLMNDIGGEAIARLSLPLATFTGLAFFITTLIFPARFMVFIIYEALILLMAICGYGWLMLTGQLTGSGLMFTGLLLTLLAAVVQTRKNVRVTWIWVFDYNGLFHLIQLVANVFILLGLRVSLMK